jgi:hypothetical protein
VEEEYVDRVWALLQAALDGAAWSFNGLQLPVGEPRDQDDEVAIEDEYAGMYS